MLLLLDMGEVKEYITTMLHVSESIHFTSLNSKQLYAVGLVPATGNGSLKRMVITEGSHYHFRF